MKLKTTPIALLCAVLINSNALADDLTVEPNAELFVGQSAYANDSEPMAMATTLAWLIRKEGNVCDSISFAREAASESPNQVDIAGYGMLTDLFYLGCNDWTYCYLLAEVYEPTWVLGKLRAGKFAFRKIESRTIRSCEYSADYN